MSVPNPNPYNRPNVDVILRVFRCMVKPSGKVKLKLNLSKFNRLKVYLRCRVPFKTVMSSIKGTLYKKGLISVFWVAINLWKSQIQRTAALLETGMSPDCSFLWIYDQHPFRLSFLRGWYLDYVSHGQPVKYKSKHHGVLVIGATANLFKGFPGSKLQTTEHYPAPRGQFQEKKVNRDSAD